MTYILAPERDADPAGAFARYRDYLQQESRRFPPGALGLATSAWYLDAADHRAPHDAWLLGASLEETGKGARSEERTVSLRLRLLGAYHDFELELYYPRVFAYTFHGPTVDVGHRDWRYDEFRLDAAGRLIHEIQWHSPNECAHWVITANDVVFTARETG
jgi:hypothetical protein